MEQGESAGNVFDEMGIYWSEIADKNHTQRQIDFLKQHLKPSGYVLDVACGSGRHMIGLAAAGYSMVGIDVSANLLKIAKQRGASQLVRGDMRFLPFKAEAFTAAISMDTSFGYLPTEADDLWSLAEIRRVLYRGGGLVLDVFNHDHLAGKYTGAAPVGKRWEYPSFTLKQERTVIQSGSRLCDLWTVTDRTNGQVEVFEHTVRLYQRRQLELLLTSADFTVESVFGDYENQLFTADSSRLILLASAK